MADRPVLVLHEGWGRTVGIDRVLDRLSSAGIDAEAPDLFAPVPTLVAAPLAAVSLVFGRGAAFRRADAAFGRLRPSAVIGLSLGAAIALRRPWPVPIVAAYGHVPRRVTAPGPIFGVYGVDDPLLRASAVRLMQVPEARVEMYEGAGHSFLLGSEVPSSVRRAGSQRVSDTAWDDILDYLHAAAVRPS